MSKSWLKNLARQVFPGAHRGNTTETITNTCGFTSYLKIGKGVSLSIWLDSFVSRDKDVKMISYGFEFDDAILVNKVRKALNRKFHFHSESDIQNIGESRNFCLNKAASSRLRYYREYVENFPDFGTHFVTKYMGIKNPQIGGDTTKIAKEIRQYYDENLEAVLLALGTARQRRELSEDGILEGYKVEFYASGKARPALVRLRRSALAKAGNKCEACKKGVLGANGRWVLDVHHKVPIAAGVRKTKPADLTVLCPTCHRTAHTQKIPLSVQEIRKLVG